MDSPLPESREPRRTNSRNTPLPVPRVLILLNGGSPGRHHSPVPPTLRPLWDQLALRSPAPPSAPRSTPPKTEPAPRIRERFIAGSRASCRASLPGMSLRELEDARASHDMQERNRQYAVNEAYSAARTQASDEAFRAFASAAASQQAFAVALGHRRLKWWSFVWWRGRIGAERYLAGACALGWRCYRQRRLRIATIAWSERAVVARLRALQATRHLRCSRLLRGMQKWRLAWAALAAEARLRRLSRAAAARAMRAQLDRWRRNARDLQLLRAALLWRGGRALSRAVARWRTLAAWWRRGTAGSRKCRVLWHTFALTRSQFNSVSGAFLFWAEGAAAADEGRYRGRLALRNWRNAGLRRGWGSLAAHAYEGLGAHEKAMAACAELATARVRAALLLWMAHAAEASWAARLRRAAAAGRRWQLRGAVEALCAAMRSRQQALRAGGHRARRKLTEWSSAAAGRAALRAAGASLARAADAWRDRAARRRAWGEWRARLATSDCWAVVAEAAVSRTSRRRERGALVHWGGAVAVQRAFSSLLGRGDAFVERRALLRAIEAWSDARAWRLRFAVCRSVGLCAGHARAWSQWLASIALERWRRECMVNAASCEHHRRCRHGLKRWVERVVEQLEHKASEREALLRLQPFFLPPLSLLRFVAPMHESRMLRGEAAEGEGESSEESSAASLPPGKQRRPAGQI